MNQGNVFLNLDERGVATLTLNRPERHNAIDDELIQELTAQLRKLAKEDAVRVVILAGEGKSFSAGADLNWMRRMADYSNEENVADAATLAELLRTLDHLPKPTIARVHGAAIGGGIGLVACCDMAVASDVATFSLSEVKLGLIPATIGPYVVRAIGERNARRVFLSAERFNAQTAWNMGLIHEITTPEGLDGAVERLVSTLLQNGPQAMAEAKALVAAVANRPIDDAMIADTAQRIADRRASA